jgi:gliding motility-associated-like protein
MTIRKLLLALAVLLTWVSTNAQTSTEFWFAPPYVSPGHVANNPAFLRIASGDNAAVITVDQPANPGFNGGTPITVNLAANSSTSIDFSTMMADLQTTPSDQVLTTGLRIVSTENITCYYEVNTINNPDIYALKGKNGLGKEFYTPIQNSWRNGDYTPTPYTSFDIVATEDNTTVIIYPRVDLDGGHSALQSYTVTLDQGETYSGSVTSTDGSDNPTGTAIVSDKDIAVSTKDDSAWPQPAGCKDLIGDQLVPVDIVGFEYIINKGGLTVPEYVYLTSTANSNAVIVDGTQVATLFAGETYRVEINDPLTYINCSQPTYAFHVSGFGCEVGGALLPPLNCAGSEQVNFVRSTNEYFGLNIVVPAGAEGDFEINGDAGVLTAGDFTVVPGTAGAWMGAQIDFTTGEIPVGSNNIITNASEVFSVGLINGGAGSGCRFGYFSEFSGEIIVDPGTDLTVCTNSTAQLAGSVTGGATTGEWSTSGSGTFVPSVTDQNAEYIPSDADISAGSITLTLTSTGNCFPVSETMTISFLDAPAPDAGADTDVCSNNSVVDLAGVVDNAGGGLWSGGNGSFANNTSLITTYTPTAQEITDGSVTLTLTTTGNGICDAESDDITITFTPAPTAAAGPNQTACANNADVDLSGSVTIATGGQWSGGNGSFDPGSTALSPTYSPSAAEIASGSVTLTLTTTGNANCNAESDAVTITFTDAPTVNAGGDQTKCENNAATQLVGSVGGATGGQWSGGLGTFSPSSASLNAIYTPTAGEIASGSLILTLTTTGNGDCNSESDQMTITFTGAPTANAGTDQTVCGNNADVTLNGSVTVATGGIWSGGSGSFNPSTNALNATYSPSAAEISAGEVTLTLTTSGIGNCTAVSDDVTITIDPAPVVNAGPNQSACANNAAITLGGSVSNAGGGVWSGGNGSFSPSSNSLTATYTPTAAEISSGNVTLTLTSTNNGDCNSESDQMTITYTAAPTVSAGIDQTKCANNANVQLTGSMTGADGVQWSGGSGSFAPDNTDIDPIYTPSAAEVAAGSVTLTLTTTGNDNCNAELDQVTINFTPAPTVNAGIDRTVCGNNAEVTLNGTVTVASGGIWSGGAGSFSPSASDVDAVYTPAPEEITAGSVTLTLTSAGNGNCTPVTDDMTINFTPAPVVNAGSDLAACANNAQVTLSGSVSNAGGGTWSGGNGTFSPSNSTLNASYTPTTQEIASGSVTLTLTSTNNGNCLAESDNVTIVYGPAPEVAAGSDQTKCANNPTIQLNGNMFGADGVQWTGGLGTFSPSNTALNAVYTPTAGEIASGNIFLTLTSTGNDNCNAVTDQLEVTFTAAPTADANLDQTVCASSPEVQLDGSVTIASGGQWSGGNGVFSPNANALDATYTPTSAEITSGEVILTLTTTGNGNCLPGTDEIIITIEPQATANAGPNQTSCANDPTIDLAGIVTNAGGGIWSGGNGVFNPSNTDLNAIYTPTAAEIGNGSVTLTLTTTDNGSCLAGSDNMTLTISPSPVANAGADQTACVNNADIQLNGSVNLAAGGTWSGGLGAFTPNNNALNAVYTPTQTELNSGSVTLTLTTTGNGSCLAEDDEVTINFTPAPSADAGTDITVCANNTEVQLDGTINLASGGTWTGGSGTFSPDASTLDAVYTPTTAEIAAGTLTLTLSSTGNGNCSVETDEVEITITPAPAVNAGENQTVCEDDDNVALSGSVSGPTNSGQWTTMGSGSFVPSAQTLNASYQFSQADYDAGTVTLVLTSTNNGSCVEVTDSIEIEILPGGVAEAGDDVTVCANNSDIQLNGVISGGATTGEWSTSGSGTFVPNAQALNATYLPSTGDNNNGFVTLTLTSNSCNDASDDVEVTITPAPEVDAGDDVTICESETEIILEGEISGATTTGIWSTTGTGTFNPDVNALDATYEPSAADYNNQSVSLVLTATGIGSCSPVNDSLHVDILPAATVNAGNNQTLCANNASVQLNGSVSGGNATAVWTTSGTGTFEPSGDVLNASYLPSQADTLNGTVDLILSAVNSCNNDVDFITITFTDAPLVNAGDDQSICGTNPIADLSGTVTGATGGVWSTNGGGSFTPNDQSLNASYQATTADVAAGEITIYLTTTGNGQCVAESDSLLLEFTDGISVNAGNDQSICSTSDYTQLNGSVTNGSTTGIWTTSGTGTFVPGNETLNATYEPSQADVDAGEITLTLTSTNNGSCAGEVDQMTISFGPSAFADAGADITVCASAPEVDVEGFVSGGSTTGQWSTSGSGAFTPDANSLDATYTPSENDIFNGTVNLILSSTDNGSCQPGMDTLTVTINPIPTIGAGSDITICEQTESVFLNGSVTNAEGATWTSSGTGTFEPSADDLNAEYVPSLSDLSVGEITLTLTSFGSEICSPVSDQVVITVSDPFSPQFTFDGACAGQPLQFTDESEVFFGSITEWSWEFGDGLNSSAQNPVHGFEEPGVYDVTLTITSSLGCEESSTQSIVIIDNPTAEFLMSDTTIAAGETIVFTDLSQDAESWSWSFGDGNSSDAQNPENTYVAPGTYNISLTVENEQGCSNTFIQTITVTGEEEEEVLAPVLPTGFSPNGDGENDLLIVRGGPFKELTLKVYNNWGNLVFETQDPDQGWDGTTDGDLQPVGDYVYTIYAVTEDDREFNRSGNVTIIK